MATAKVLNADAKPLGLFVYKDPDCRNRFVIVGDKEWDAAALAAEVARPGGMRWSPHFIGTSDAVRGYLFGLEIGKFGPLGLQAFDNTNASESPHRNTRSHDLHVSLCDDTVRRFDAGEMTNDEEHDLLVELMSTARPADPSDIKSAA